MPSSDALPPPARPPVCGMLMPILIGGCWAPTFEVSPSMAAPAPAVASRRRREIDADLVVFSVMDSSPYFILLDLLYSILRPRPRSNLSQRRQDNLRRQRNLGDNSAKRPERIIHRIGDRRGCPRRSRLACALCPQLRLRCRRNHMPNVYIGHFAGHRNQI